MIAMHKIRCFKTGAAALALMSLLLVAARADAPSEDNSTTLADSHGIPYKMWITGEVFIHNGLLLFHTDKPVRGDSGDNVVFLGATRSAAGELLPAYMKAARNQTRVRLYGALLSSGPVQGYVGSVPSVEFVTWRLHQPGESDTPAAGSFIPIGSTSLARYPDEAEVLARASTTGLNVRSESTP